MAWVAVGVACLAVGVVSWVGMAFVGACGVACVGAC